MTGTINNSDLSLGKVKITSSFWNKYRELIVKEVLPYQWKVMNDKADINIAEDPQAGGVNKKSHAVANLKIAAGKIKGHHYGYPFQDSDVYKWLEAAAYSFSYHPDEKLRQITDSVIDLIADAQDPDGYLDTLFQIDMPDRKFKRLQQSHELYTMGHYIEAGVAYYQATENQQALNIARKIADCIGNNFGPEAGKIHGYDGHPEIELALARLYEITKEKRYLDLAHYFLLERGQDPQFFNKQIAKDGDDNEHDLIDRFRTYPLTFWQAAEPIVDQKTAEGHAVRVGYMLTGVTHVARLTHDKALMETGKRLWRDIVKRRMYITGGVGSNALRESYTFDYDLPNDTVYGETCAAVSMVFFARQLLDVEAKGEYADVIEKELFNGALSGISLDGKHFFYVNPLEADPKLSKYNPAEAHVLTHRADWFGCACCPANLARLIASIDQYIYNVVDNKILSHQFISNEAEFTNGISVKQESNFPWEGDIKYTLHSDHDTDTQLGIRIPSWSQGRFTLLINGKEITAKEVNGFVYIDIVKGTTNIELNLTMSTHIMRANTRVRDDMGKIAVQRGPVIYCTEEADNSAPLWAYRLNATPKFSSKFESGLLHGVVSLETSDAEKAEDDGEELYLEDRNIAWKPSSMKFIPYYAWANRKNGQMRVWQNINK
jgi:DUF1680 family protein